MTAVSLRTPFEAHDGSAGGSPMAALASALRSPACYPHRVDRVRILETHISTVLLAGAYAYKIKKPVNLGFLDFSTLEARREFCEKELRINRRTAPALYLDVVPVTGQPSAPFIGGPGKAIEYAVRMRRFPQESLLDHQADAGLLWPAHVEALARSLVRFHATADRAAPNAGFGTPELVLSEALDNFKPLEAAGLDEDLRESVALLKAWVFRKHGALAGDFTSRLMDGHVRECHGDLHLGNLVLIADEPVAFDALEFDEHLRWIDVASDVAFVHMDLLHHGLPDLAARFLNAWCEASSDFAGLRVLSFYLVYRAMVRAKVAAIRQSQAVTEEAKDKARGDVRAYVELAGRLAMTPAPAVIAMHGLSGSGKTTVSLALVDAMGAIRLRSDVERKRLHGLDPLARARAGVGEGLYAESATDRTYARLADIAKQVVGAGWPVVVDATFLEARRRDAFRALARDLGAPFAIAACEAPGRTLYTRIVERTGTSRDASDATLEVLDRQRARSQLFTDDERARTVTFDTRNPDEQGATIAVLARLLDAHREA